MYDELHVGLVPAELVGGDARIQGAVRTGGGADLKPRHRRLAGHLFHGGQSKGDKGKKKHRITPKKTTHTKITKILFSMLMMLQIDKINIFKCSLHF